jgi:hypothetical protein
MIRTRLPCLLKRSWKEEINMETTALRLGVSLKIFLVGFFVVMAYAVSASADYRMEGTQLDREVPLHSGKFFG